MCYAIFRHFCLAGSTSHCLYYAIARSRNGQIRSIDVGVGEPARYRLRYHDRVYSAHRIYLTESSSLRAHWKGLSSRLIIPHSNSQSLPGLPLPHRFMVCLPPSSPLYGDEFSISLNSAIFFYTAGPATFEFALWQAAVGFLIHRVCLLTAACLPTFTKRWREKYFSHIIELWNEYFHKDVYRPAIYLQLIAWISNLLQKYFSNNADFLKKIFFEWIHMK